MTASINVVVSIRLIRKVTCFYISFIEPPKNLRIENFENQSTVHKKEGEELILKCTVESGQPKEILRFEKNGNIIKESNTSTVNLTVTLSHTDHESRYTCKAISTALNVSLSQTIAVNVFCEYFYCLTVIYRHINDIYIG